MTRQVRVEVAVLLASYNGERYVEQQLRSLTNNDTQFTLHWLDDHSTDNTREIVRSVARSAGISLREWHQSRHSGVPRAFFEILERVEADVYLFCDQDDIWQTGKIDATVENLLPDLSSPVICFTDPLIFREEQPGSCFRLLDIYDVRVEAAIQESRIFMPVVANGNTVGFTRPLRDLYFRHKDIARAHAYMHDVWMYNIGVASGTARFMPHAPTALYRWHRNNMSSAFGDLGVDGTPRITITWQQHQLLRRTFARHAEGFILASATLPQSAKLNRLLEVARLVAGIQARQSPSALIKLVHRRAMWPNNRLAFGLAAACLCSDATQ